MKILFISDNFPPEVNAPASRTYEHCFHWVRRGVKVTILTCAPNYPHGRIYKGYKNKLISKEEVEGIKVIRVISYITRNRGFVRRSIDYISFAFSAFCTGLFMNFDIIVATSPQFFTTLAAFALSAIKGKPWIFEIRDLWPESIKAIGLLQDGLIYRMLERIEMILYRSASIIFPVTETFKTRLVSRGVEKSKICVVTNGANLDLFRPRNKNRKILKSLRLQNKFVIGYIGTYGLAQGLDFIMKAISKIEDGDIHFLFIGDGTKKDEVINLSKELDLKNITFLPMVSKNRVVDYLSIVDVSLVPLIKVDTFKTVIPSKIFESCAMGKPVLLGVEGEAMQIVSKYGAGLCYEPENENEFIEKIFEIKRNERLYGKLSNGCIRLARKYNRKTLAAKMINHIEEWYINGQLSME